MKVQRIRSLGMIYILIVSFFLVGLSPGVTAVADTISDNSHSSDANTTGVVSGSSVVADTSDGTVSPMVTSKPVKDHWKIKTKKCSYPKKLNRGSGFSVEGIVKSNEKLSYVVAGIANEQGKFLYSHTIYVKKKTCYLAKADNALKFSRLGKGTYHYIVRAFNKKKQMKQVIDKKFTVTARKWSWPVYGGVMGDGWHCHCSSHHGKHYGVDIKGAGRSIHATHEGTVVYAKYHSGSSLGSFGKLVVIYHGNGVYSYYAHCASLKVKAGEQVKQGHTIATVGSTGMAYGPHLHFELRRGPAFHGGYNSLKLVDKYTYKQFNPCKKGYLKKYAY